MKRLSTLVAMTVVLSSLTGCCCWSPWAGGGACGNGGCNYPSYGQPVPQGTTLQSYDAVTGLPVHTTTAYQPVVAAPTVALGPMEALPTYR